MVASWKMGIVTGIYAAALGIGCSGSPPSELSQVMAAIEDEDADDMDVVDPAVPADFDIRKFGIKTFQGARYPYLKVAGHAGGTQPDPATSDILAYVFVTDAGVFAVASHGFNDSSEQMGDPDLTWHAHKVTLDAQNCISSIDETGEEGLTRKRVFLAESGATTVSKVLTARLTVDAGSVCVAQVYDVME